MGPKSTYLGPEIPREDFIWQDPIPTNPLEKISSSDIRELKELIIASNLSSSSLISLGLLPLHTDTQTEEVVQMGKNCIITSKNWECNNPELLENVLKI